MSLAQTLTQPQHWGRSQSGKIGLYAHLADTAQTEGTMKCQWMALRKLGIVQEEELASHTHSLFRVTPCRPSEGIKE